VFVDFKLIRIAMNFPGAICRIGVFYDGSFFAKAQRFFHHERKLGWLQFQPFHEFIEHFLRSKEPGFGSYKVLYAAWHQGLFTIAGTKLEDYQRDRRQDHDLMHAGVEPKYLPMSQGLGEKGTDVALAVDALQVGLDGKIDIAVLVTGDGDYVPLVRALNKHNVRVMAAYFTFTDNIGKKSYINKRLLNCCNYAVDVSELDKDREFKGDFKGLFRSADEWRKDGQEDQVAEPK
jgi:uncharacterized LabA/DUF88 family protein